jgi:hypothetical protein
VRSQAKVGGSHSIVAGFARYLASGWNPRLPPPRRRHSRSRRVRPPFVLPSFPVAHGSTLRLTMSPAEPSRRLWAFARKSTRSSARASKHQSNKRREGVGAGKGEDRRGREPREMHIYVSARMERQEEGSSEADQLRRFCVFVRRRRARHDGGGQYWRGRICRPPC